MTLGADPSHLAAALAVVRELGLTPLVNPEPFVVETYVLPCIEEATGIRVDLVWAAPA